MLLIGTKMQGLERGEGGTWVRSEVSKGQTKKTHKVRTMTRDLTRVHSYVFPNA